ncbi:MAG: hypothetical protein ABIN36_03115 [Ferruginibacter sp.]
MQQGNNDIENNLRQLENQQLPDLSNMDKHWQQMEQMLLADGKPKVARKLSFLSFYGRKLFLAAAIITIVFAALIYRFAQTNTVKNSVALIAKKTADKKENKSIQDSSPNTETVYIKEQPQTATQANNKLTTDSNLSTSTTSVDEVVLTEAEKDEATKKMMSTFYNNIQKPIQEFTVNADKGGSFTGNEGTIFSIPPSAFTDKDGKIISGEVEVLVEEFYKYADMVAANLTTTSNNKQLLTGGMIRITANANGRYLNLRSSKEIKLVMPTSNYDPEMRLFTSESEPANNGMATYASYAPLSRNIDWDVAGQQDVIPVYDGKTNFPDDLDQPYVVIKTLRKRIAKFALSDKSSLTTDQMEKILNEKYGDYYDEIKVKRQSDPGRSSGNVLYRGTIEKENVIGDSSRMTLEQALRTRVIEKKEAPLYIERIKADSILYLKRVIAYRYLNALQGEQKTVAKENYQLVYASTKSISPDSLERIYNNYIKKQKAYSFSIKKMGWINCDKYSNCSNKTNFVINLPAGVEADKFVSQVVFISTHSVMPGRTLNNQIGFNNIPADIGVYVVGLGERNGKVVSFMQKLRVGRSQVNINDLQETTPEAFRKKIAELDIN